MRVGLELALALGREFLTDGDEDGLELPISGLLGHRGELKGFGEISYTVLSIWNEEEQS